MTPLAPQTGTAYEKLHQPASGFAIVGVAARLTLGKDGKIEDAGVGVTGLGPKAFRAEAVEKALRGKKASDKIFTDAARYAAQGVEPLSDLHASADYRREMASVYTRRALERAFARGARQRYEANCATLAKRELRRSAMDLRYPIGKYEPKAPLSPAERANAISQIAAAPKSLRDAVAGLSQEQLDTPYRPGGWTVRQVVHHLPDSHLNAYVRFKLALTEDEPTIKPFDEARWAELQDSRETPVEVSLALLEALHQRWDVLLRSLRPEDFARRLRHPERGLMTLDDMVGIYAWHGRHHVAHITSLREREGWK